MLAAIFCLPIMSYAQKSTSKQSSSITTSDIDSQKMVIDGWVVWSKRGYGQIVEKKVDNESGIATVKYENGYIYIGKWKNDQPNGAGELTLPNGAKYLTKFKNGVPREFVDPNSGYSIRLGRDGSMKTMGY